MIKTLSSKSNLHNKEGEDHLSHSLSNLRTFILFWYTLHFFPLVENKVLQGQRHRGVACPRAAFPVRKPMQVSVVNPAQ